MIRGLRYDFEVCADKGFYIKAICRKSGRHSCVTNVNIILSALDVDGRKYFDSSWNVNDEEGKRLKERAVEFLCDKKFLKYVEEALDEDRREGEWE